MICSPEAAPRVQAFVRSEHVPPVSPRRHLAANSHVLRLAPTPLVTHEPPGRQRLDRDLEFSPSWSLAPTWSSALTGPQEAHTFRAPESAIGIGDCRRSSEQMIRPKTKDIPHTTSPQVHMLISRPRGAHMCMTCNMSPRTMRPACQRPRGSRTFQIPAGRLDGGGGGVAGAAAAMLAWQI